LTILHWLFQWYYDRNVDWLLLFDPEAIPVIHCYILLMIPHWYLLMTNMTFVVLVIQTIIVRLRVAFCFAFALWTLLRCTRCLRLLPTLINSTFSDMLILLYTTLTITLQTITCYYSNDVLLLWLIDSTFLLVFDGGVLFIGVLLMLLTLTWLACVCSIETYILLFIILYMKIWYSVLKCRHYY